MRFVAAVTAASFAFLLFLHLRLWLRHSETVEETEVLWSQLKMWKPIIDEYMARKDLTL